MIDTSNYIDDNSKNLSDKMINYFNKSNTKDYEHHSTYRQQKKFIPIKKVIDYEESFDSMTEDDLIELVPKSDKESTKKKFSPNKSFGKAKWQKLSNVLFTLYSLKKERVVKILNESQLHKNIGLDAETPKNDSEKNKPGHKIDTFKEFVDRVYFFNCINRSSEQDYDYIKSCLENDPKRFILEGNDPERLCNKVNVYGQTPLYVACKHGNLKIIKLLISYKANVYQMSQVASKKQESILDIAVRWSHLPVVEYLIENHNWTNKMIKEALKHSTNTPISKLLKSKLLKKKNSCFFFGSSSKSYLQE